MITITNKGDFSKTEAMLRHIKDAKYIDALKKYAEVGVEALSAATPKESGETASSWTYEIEDTGSGYSVVWKNTHMNEGVNVALLIQYGHGTGTGGYVSGIDYINPALHSVFDGMAEAVWKEVAK